MVGIYNDHPDHNITVIRFSRNFGKESAIYAGMKNAIGDAICIIDADLQQRPETALKMYQKLRNSPTCDCVTAFQRVRHEGRIVGLHFIKSSMNPQRLNSKMELLIFEFFVLR